VRKIRTAATVAALKRLAAETTTIRNATVETNLDEALTKIIEPSADIYYRPLPRKPN
jgi:hypothetical protein